MNLNLNFFFINLEFFNYFNLQYRQSSEFETWAEADDCLGHISTQLIIYSPSCEKLLWWFVLWVGYQHTMLMMRPAGTWCPELLVDWLAVYLIKKFYVEAEEKSWEPILDGEQSIRGD